MNRHERLLAFRKAVFCKIAQCLEIDSHHKSYEGTIEVMQHWPDYFSTYEEEPTWSVTLHCYLLCVGRHQTWEGKTLDECLDQAEAWLEERQ